MKKTTYLFVMLLCASFLSFAQNTNLQKAQNYLASKGEVCFTFTPSNEAQLIEISNFLSIGHKVNRETLLTEGYANADSFQQFLSLGIPFNVNQNDNEFTAKSNSLEDTLTWDEDWNAYPTYSQYVAKMNYFASTYPTLCTLESIGTSVNGRDLLMLKISDNVTSNEAEPEFMYTSSIHGDELAGFPLMIRLIDYLLSNYNNDTEVNDIVNSTVIYINPLANPDGAYGNINSNVIDNPTRANANGQDLNRNYADNVAGLHYDGTYEPETRAFMDFEANHNIILSANFHGGTELVNYPYDNTYDEHADHDWFEYISVEYATNAQNNSPSDYMIDDEDSAIYPSPGVTHGAQWYRVYGGRQDYMNFYRGGREVTIELSDIKWIQGSAINAHWNYNKQALLDFLKQANNGVQGIITDTSGNSLKAKVSISNHDNLNSFIFSNADLGDYYRLLKAGNYTLTYEIPGYITQTENLLITDGIKTDMNIVMTPTTALPATSNVTINENESASLFATGVGELNWYENSDDITPIFVGNNFITPTLIENTSYFVEDIISQPNVGSIDHSSNGSFFAGGTGDRYLVFDCTNPVNLKKVTINALNTGEMEVRLTDNTNQVLDTKLVFIDTPGVQEINLNFYLPVANDLRLTSADMSSGLELFRNDGGTSYPYANNSVTIKTSNVSDQYYYFFYDWEIGAIKSQRQEVQVTVEETLGIENSHTFDNLANLYPNPFNDQIVISFQNDNSSSISVDIYDLSGRSISKIIPLQNQDGLYRLSNLNHLSSGSYFFKITDKLTQKSIVKRVIKN